MSHAKTTRVNRVAMLHDLMVELGRVELQLEDNDKPSTSVEQLQVKRSKLQSALSRLGARFSQNFFLPQRRRPIPFRRDGPEPF